MKFNSIREYFYKMYNALYVLILLPLIAFIILYLQVDNGKLDPMFKEDESMNMVLLIIVGSSAAADLAISFLFFNGRLKSLRKTESLGERLSRYYSLTVVRFLITTMGLLLLVGGFYLTQNQFFTGMFVVFLGAISFLWPTSSKVCNDLKLRGDERLMVLHKKEILY